MASVINVCKSMINDGSKPVKPAVTSVSECLFGSFCPKHSMGRSFVIN